MSAAARSGCLAKRAAHQPTVAGSATRTTQRSSMVAKGRKVPVTMRRGPRSAKPCRAVRTEHSDPQRPSLAQSMSESATYCGRARLGESRRRDGWPHHLVRHPRDLAGASTEEVRSACEARGRQVSPQMISGAPSKVIKAADRARAAAEEAWRVLGDPSSRERYEVEAGIRRKGSVLERPQPIPSGPEWDSPGWDLVEAISRSQRWPTGWPRSRPRRAGSWSRTSAGSSSARACAPSATLACTWRLSG
jgi:hypothetical protein